MSSFGSSIGPQPHSHYVQFYKADEPMLNRNVGRFFWEGFLRGDGLLVVATPQRCQSLSHHLARIGVDVEVALREEQLSLIGAHELLREFMVEGVPAWEPFERAITTALGRVRPRGSAHKCVYGEMVGILWEAGQPDAAIRVEEFWNTLLHRDGFTLFCGYPIDVFDGSFHSPQAQAIVCAHTSLVPTGPNGDLDESLERAMDEVLGSGAQEMRRQMKASLAGGAHPMATGESAILWLRNHLPQDAEVILARARQHYTMSHANA